YVFTSSAFLPELALAQLGEAGKAIVEGVIFTGYQWDPREAKENVLEFSKKFEAEFHTLPTIYAATGYDAVFILARSIDTINHRLADNVKTAVNNGTFHGLLG